LDVIGRAAIGQDGVAVGAVVGVHNFGAGGIIEIAPGGGGATVLVPFTRDTVPEIDIEGGRITLDPPEGLFE
jgi:16S rRNA processing protein RimM